MIYQCYFRPEQRDRLFGNAAIYRGFGLEPEVNPDLTLNCPELASADVRLQLVDFAAMLHMWRNPPLDDHHWIGFTSYRQPEKVSFTWENQSTIEELLAGHDVLHWGRLSFDKSLSEQAEACHPGINCFMSRMLRDLGEPFPTRYLVDQAGFYIDYWIMSRDRFDQHMTWLAPFIQYGLERLTSDPYLKSHPKALAYVLERLFVIWYYNTKPKIYDVHSGATFVANERKCVKQPKRTVSIACPVVSANAGKLANEAIRDGRLSHGKYIEEFERQIAEYVGRRFAIATSSGTMADTIALAAMAHQTGKRRVVVPALTFVAQPNAVVQAGLEPVFCDVREDFLLDMDKARILADSLNAIICPADLMGRVIAPCPGYSVMEDACEALGSTRGGKPAGSLGTAGTFSFFVSHTIGIGEGGAIVTDNEDLAMICRSMRDHGREGIFEFPRPGFNGKLTNVVAAIGVAAMSEIDGFVDARRRTYLTLERALLQFPERENEQLVPHGYPVRFESQRARNSSIRQLTESGIECRPLFSCVPNQEHFKVNGSFPVAQELAATYLYVPCHHLMSDDDCQHVVRSVKDCLQRSSETSETGGSCSRCLR